ncbi:MAG: malonate transporter subunit MadL [Sporomusaceae bacterium]|nr:malonate transporter subunit MadL [Sporomusaceae bacterium]
MAIYGVALLSFCYFVGVWFGDVLGALLGVKANVGGVGFAMFLLIILTQKLMKAGKLSKPAQDGIAFWNAMYIPIVVAMTAQQNVLAALKGGPLALAAGTLSVAVAFLFVPLLSKIGKAKK